MPDLYRAAKGRHNKGKKNVYLCKTGVIKEGYTSDNDYIENIGDIV
jgi:hypothetical protein